jgi:beta-galactosidase
MPIVSHPWTSPELVSLGRLPMHAVRHDERLSLDGTWRFQLLETPTADLAADAWREIGVPGCWTRQDTWDVPQYTNVQMPFSGVPPDLPAVNPTGIYERTVDVPAEWASRRIVLHVGAAESVLLARVNGIDIGMSKDSHLAAEFDVSAVLQPGANEIRLTVVKWSDATYVEDQDQWWHGGITRSVFLYATDRTYLADVGAIAGLEPDLRTGTLQLTADVASLGAEPEPGWSVEASIPGLLAPVRGSVPLQAPPDHPQDPGSMDLMRRHAVGGPAAVAERAADWAELERRLVPPLGGRVTFDLRLPTVEPWSTEIPQRYDLDVDLLAPDGRIVERATLQIGFRRVEVSGVDLLINGRRVLIRGVNRHDFDQHTGRVVSEASMRDDVVAMKRFGFNAVRTSHYPNDPVFLDLCDELGLYAIDEADIESHAFQSTLCDDPRYLAQWVTRVARMAIRDRNHPSIIAWSLGNESGHGANHDAAAAWLRRFDPSRPLHYEGAIRWDWTSDQAISDLTCPMYPELVAIIDHAGSGLQRHPLIMCEYSHAMGNSNGTLADHWDAIEATPGLQGGFIWEWRDHGLLQSLPGGAVRWAYGGDFGDVPNDGNFCADGLTWPDGAPKPALWEHRALAAPLAIAWTGTALAITNRRDFTDLGDLRMVWDVIVDGEVAASGRAKVPGIAPGATEHLELAGFPDSLPGGREVWLTTRWLLDRSLPWASEGFEVCALQVPLTTSVSDPPEVATRAAHPSGSSAQKLHVDDAGDLRHPLIAVSPRLSLWRAPTDNDRIGGIAATWSALGLDQLERRLLSLDRAADGRVTTVDDVTTGCGAVIRHERSVRDVGSGEVRIDEAVTVPDELVDVARVGIELEVVPGLETMDWFGRGPHESYPDRKRGALVGRWRSTVPEQTVPYIRPQENGGHADVRWLELADDTGQTLRLSFDRPMQVSATHHRATALAAAPHHEELTSTDTTIVHIDVAHRGLGTASCGPDTLPAYLVGPGTYRWSWTVRA